jgi:lysozyme
MSAPTISRKSLVAIVGATAAAVLMVLVPKNEGTVYKTYRDIGGVLTYCTGATDDAQWGKTYTPSECKAQLDKDLATHAEGVMACVRVPLTDGQRVAFVDTAYNIGVSAFCGSSMARKANAGDMPGACAALSLWVNVKGKPVQGLINRRALARAWCEGRKAA